MAADETGELGGGRGAAGRRRVSRRTALAIMAAGGAGAVTGLAACSGSSPPVTTGSPAAPERPATASPRTTGPEVTFFGAPSSFGQLAGAARLTGGQSVGTVGVPGFAFGPGQAAYTAAVAGDGTVFVGTTPFTDNQLQPTGEDLELGVFEPDQARFTRLVIPTTTGATDLSAIDPTRRGTGGGDVADLEIVPLPGGGERVAFVVTAPYQGWDTGKYGLLPTFGQLVRDGSGDSRWRYDAALSRTGDRLAKEMKPAAAAAAFPPRTDPALPRDNRGTTELARFPHSGHLVVLQYFGGGVSVGQPAGSGQGAVLVLDADGRVRAWWQYPDVLVLGQSVKVNPREVMTDPSSEPDDERFVAVLDCTDAAGATVPFTLQEFSYQASTGTVRPRSTAVRAAQDGSRMEATGFAADGTLYVARTAADGLTAAPLAVYARLGGDGERGLVTHTPAGPNWQVSTWGSTCTPDQTVAATARGGLVRSLVVDQATGTALLTGEQGLLQAVGPTGTGRNRTYQVRATVDIGLDLLRAPSRRYLGVRRGAVDAGRRLHWIPCNQLVLDGLTWPYPPFRLDQWLCRVDLSRLVD